MALDGTVDERIRPFGMERFARSLAAE